MTTITSHSLSYSSQYSILFLPVLTYKCIIVPVDTEAHFCTFYCLLFSSVCLLSLYPSFISAGFRYKGITVGEKKERLTNFCHDTIPSLTHFCICSLKEVGSWYFHPDPLLHQKHQALEISSAKCAKVKAFILQVVCGWL